MITLSIIQDYKSHKKSIFQVSCVVDTSESRDSKMKLNILIFLCFMMILSLSSVSASEGKSLVSYSLEQIEIYFLNNEEPFSTILAKNVKTVKP